MLGELQILRKEFVSAIFSRFPFFSPASYNWGDTLLDIKFP